MSVVTILHEASTVLKVALRYASELSEVGITNRELLRMRELITRVASHNYTAWGDNTNATAELHELQNVKEVILKTAEQRFGSTSAILREFHYPAVKKPDM